MPERLLAEQINEAIGIHGAWKMRLRTAINSGRADITPDLARCDDQCAFGQWLEQLQIDPASHAGLSHHVIRQLHAEFHRSAADVLALALKRDRHGARALMDGDFSQRAEQLTRALAEWKRIAA